VRMRMDRSLLYSGSMKKTTTRLALKTQTVRLLTNQQIEEAKGGTLALLLQGLQIRAGASNSTQSECQ